MYACTHSSYSSLFCSDNHTWCYGFKTASYRGNEIIARTNTSASEQINAKLARLESSLAYSTGASAIALLEVFIARHNFDKRNALSAAATARAGAGGAAV
jgi:hypothetical protein